MKSRDVESQKTDKQKANKTGLYCLNRKSSWSWFVVSSAKSEKIEKAAKAKETVNQQ